MRERGHVRVHFGSSILLAHHQSLYTTSITKGQDFSLDPVHTSRGRWQLAKLP